MSASCSVPGSGGHGKRGGASQDFELNLASIIDCFTVLIAFMLVTASFLSIGVLDAGVAAAGATSAGGAPPPVSVFVELKGDRSIAVKIQGKTNANHSYSAVGEKKDEWDYAAVNARLAQLKQQYPDVNALTLSAENTVQYKDVVKTMESVRKAIPVVLLGGF